MERKFRAIPSRCYLRCAERDSRGYPVRSSPPRSRATRSVMTSTARSASSSVRVRSAARKSTEKARLFLPSGMGAPSNTSNRTTRSTSLLDGPQDRTGRRASIQHEGEVPMEGWEARDRAEGTPSVGVLREAPDVGLEGRHATHDVETSDHVGPQLSHHSDGLSAHD